MPLIPQNTLLGLPDELIGQIMSYVVTMPGPIDTRRRILSNGKLITEPYTTLGPFSDFKGNNAILQTIATEEYYNGNTFSVAVLKDEDRSGGIHIRYDSSQGRLVKNLLVKFHDFDDGMRDCTPDKLAGYPEIVMLNRVIAFCPKLQTLTLSIKHHVHDVHDANRRNGYMAMETQAASDEFFLPFLTNMLNAVRTVSTPKLTAKSIVLAHQGIYHTVELPNREPVALSCDVENLAWNMLDTPKAIVRLPIDRSAEAERKQQHHGKRCECWTCVAGKQLCAHREALDRDASPERCGGALCNLLDSAHQTHLC